MTTSSESNARIDFSIDPDDEFSEDYEDPGALTAGQVQGAVVYTLDWTVSTVVEQIDADPDDPDSMGFLVTSPPFQRRTAWNDQRKSLFIESLMLGLPIPPIVLAESQVNPSQFYVLDGKQRLTALKAFIDTEGDPLKLKGLELLQEELSGMTYEEVRTQPNTRNYVRSLNAQPIRTIVVRNWQTPALLHLIFTRLNKQSVPLASHELRQALFPGKMTNFVNKESGDSRELLDARRLKAPDARLRDAETLLRYIAFRTNIDKYRGDLRDFLDRVLKGGNEAFSEIESDLSSLIFDLNGSIKATFKIFGKTAFLRYDAGRAKYMPRFNVSVFETMTWYFADPSIAERSVQHREEVVDAFERLVATNAKFSGYLTSTTKARDATTGRLEEWGKALGEALGMDLNYTDHIAPFLPIAVAGK
ncbi:DUF262 domain-containing protein [Streptomyces albidoflavus]|uniref:DUF262 domain-containing protein n=1 Tax=Streptomyces albidoflavus TaxID=1886 RepID=UPI00101ECFD3|nr:DUF262 domain-containing protein [Streptomyces albidoflavus]RZE77674.1 hypothetical protein C0Q99_14505 [Streptomyces albidoflavus]